MFFFVAKIVALGFDRFNKQDGKKKKKKSETEHLVSRFLGCLFGLFLTKTRPNGRDLEGFGVHVMIF